MIFKKKYLLVFVLLLLLVTNSYAKYSDSKLPPTITCPGDVSAACTHDPILNAINATTSSDVVLQTYTLTGATNLSSTASGINDASIENFLAGTTTVTYYVEDASGNSATCNFTVTVNDHAPPIVICQDDIVTVNDSGLCTAYVNMFDVNVFPTAADTCSGITTVPTGVPPGSNFPVGTTTVIWVVTDAAGNFSTCPQDITVTDEEDPTIVCPDNITASTNLGECEATVTIPPAIPNDNCTISSITNDYNSGGADASDTYPLGVTTITFLVTDTVGRITTCSFDVTVVNSQSPVITLIGNNPQTIEACTPYNELGATATDSCLGDITSSIVIDASAVNVNTVGTYNVTYNVTNASGTSAGQVIRTVNVVDTTAPTLTLTGPDPMTIGDCSTYTELGAVAIDGCLGDISSSVVIDNASVDTSVLGTYTVTYSVTDASGNAAPPITRTIIVEDFNGPIITLNGDDPQIIEACNPYDELGAIAIDPCFGTDYTADIIIDTSNVDTSIVGTYTVTYNASDIYGNDAIEIVRNIEIIDTTPPTLTLLGDNPQIVSACTPYNELGATAIDTCFGVDYTADIIIDDSSLDTSTEGTYQVTYTVCDASGNCTGTITRDVEVVLGNDSADAGSDFTNTVCTDTSIALSGNSVIGTNASGLWTVTSGQTSGFSFSDPTSPMATFTGDVGETYTLTWTIDNPEPCSDVSDSITVTFINCNALDFDGVDDNITFADNYNLTTDFTVEIWIKSDSQNNAVQTIFSKREGYDLLDGYDLRLVNNYIAFHWNNGESITSPYQINTNQWHHTAISFTNGTYKLYIDGVNIVESSGGNVLPFTNNNDYIVGAMDQSTNAPFKPINYFDGGLDELRIWNVALTETQIRKMMNQEITDINPITTVGDGFLYGASVPLQITGLDWSDLNGYYQMNQNNDLSGGNLVSNSNSVNGVLRYMTTLQPETAPLPYQSITEGDWNNSNTWLYGNSQAIPNSLGIDGSTGVDWNIVKTSHNISSGGTNITLLGLEVNANTLRIENTDPSDGQSLRITDYLIIDGSNSVLKLVGESQLLQDTGSIVDYNGTGNLHRDQQGTSNFYNYNYWGSPVSTDGLEYVIGNSLYDGTQPVQWTSGYDGIGSTTPITMSRRWLYIYENYPVNSYADWVRIDENYSVSVPLGFLMKGSGSADANQNYTFVGKPNNGTYTSPITADYEALVSNPYPSAIDAHAFINDNSSSTLGTIYFWEHYASNATHITAAYQGGFAAYNLTGGNAAISPPEISGLGTPSKIPERYIPIGQGFNVNGNSTGGDIEFNNDQRVFVKEAVTGALDNGSVFMRQQNASTNRPETEPIKRVRIDFITPEDALRPIMLGFVPNNLATDGFDYGYDALNTEDFPNDMSWMIEDLPYIIQGVGDFDETKFYPLGIFLQDSGTIEIALRGIENFEEDITIYVYDSLLKTYTLINNTNYINTLASGDYLDRFYITFSQQGILSTPEETTHSVVFNYLNDTDEIYIKTSKNETIETVALINILGQTIQEWDITKTTSELRLPVKNVAEGNYIIKLKTVSNTLAKKIVISL